MELNDKTSVQELFEQMPTEKLDNLLNEELSSDTPNGDAIRLILSVLREREKEVPVEITPKIAAAWETYQQNIAELDRQANRPRKIRSWVLRVGAAAAVLVLLAASIIPQRAEAESLWDRLARWTSDIVEFFGANDNDGRIEDYEFKTDNPGLQQVYEAAVELGVTSPVVPMWLPEGSELVEFRLESSPTTKWLHSRFVCNDSEIIFNLDIYEEDALHRFQKDETAIDTHESGGVRHYIMHNNGRLVAVWTKDNVECSLSIDCQEDILQRILDSIYDMEEN